MAKTLLSTDPNGSTQANWVISESLVSCLGSFAGESDLNTNCLRFHLTAFASNFEWIARPQKCKKVYKGSQDTEFSRKSVFGNPAILATCERYEAGNACFRWTRRGTSRSWRVRRPRVREIMFRQSREARRKCLSAWPFDGLLCSEGDLNPILGFCFPLFSRVLPGEFPSE